MARGAGPPPAFLASGWTQVDTLPFVSLGVLLVVVGFVFWDVFSFLVFFFFFALGPCRTVGPAWSVPLSGSHALAQGSLLGACMV